MIALLAVLLLAVLLAPILFRRDRRLFYGLNLYCFLNALLIVPGIFVIGAKPELLHPDIYMSVPPGTSGLAWTIAMIGLLNLMVYAGYFWAGHFRAARPAGHPTPTTVSVPGVALNPYESNLSIALLMLLAVAIFLQKLSLFGGLGGIFDTVRDRVGLQAGLGPLNFLASAAATLATILATRRALAERSGGAFAILIVVALASAVMFSLFGGRKESIQLAVMVLVVVSLYSAGFMRLRPRTLALVASGYAVALTYFIAVLIYRDGLGSQITLASFFDQLGQSFDDYGRFLLSLSYFDTYYFVTNFFDATNYYHGATFLDLPGAFIPSGLMPDKPPVDDGMYVRAATLGYLLQPGTPSSLLTHNSYPPETLGAAYMNGGPLLVAVFGMLLGAVLGKTRRLVERNPNSPFVAMVYLNVFLNFEISALRIVQFVALSVCTLLLIGLLRALALFFAHPAPPAARARARRGLAAA